MANVEDEPGDMVTMEQESEPALGGLGADLSGIPDGAALGATPVFVYFGR